MNPLEWNGKKRGTHGNPNHIIPTSEIRTTKQRQNTLTQQTSRGRATCRSQEMPRMVHIDTVITSIYNQRK